jgi:hypothetical protein
MSWATLSDISWTARGASWEALFQEWNGSAASGTFQMSAPRLRRGQEDKETVAPILESILRVKVKDSSRTIHDKLQATDYENLRLLIKKGGSEWGSYIAYKKDGGEQIVYDDPTLKLRFEGGLRRLKKLTWDARGRHELLRTLAHILSETRAKFPVRVYAEWRSTNSDLSSRGESQAFRVDTADLAGHKNVTDYFDVLRELCVSFNLQVVQYAGAWHVLQRSFRNRTMSYEERRVGGTEQQGTFDPRVTQSETKLLSWQGDYPEGTNREPIPAIRRKGTYSQQEFLNVYFTDTYTDLNGTQRWDGWADSANVAKSSTGNPVLNNGVYSGSFDYIEQSFDRVYQENDVADLILQVTITTLGTPDSPEQVDVPVLEIVRRQKHDGTLKREWWTDARGWTTSQHYFTITVETTSSTEDQTFLLENIPDIDWEAPSHNIDNFELLLRCVMAEDPDSDGDDEVKKVEFERVDTSLTKDAQGPSGETFYVGSADAELRRETATGGWDRDNQACGQVWYWNGSEWDKSENWKFSSALSRDNSLGRMGALELERQLNHDLAEVSAAVRHDGCSPIESPLIDGVRYVPTHTDEVLTRERRYMEFVEYKNE